MEKRIEELEIGLRVAEARAELLLEVVSYLCDQLAASDVIRWDSGDLKRQFLSDKDFDIADHAMAFARLDLADDGDESSEFAEAVSQHIGNVKLRMALREKIAAEIRHERTPS